MESFTIYTPLIPKAKGYELHKCRVSQAVTMPHADFITAKTIINIGGGDSSSYGQNAFFYDSAEGLLASVILLLAEFGEKNERHIVSVRQFLFAVRFRKEKDEQVFHLINRVDKAIAEHGFMTRRMSKTEIKRTLALYFGSSLSGESIADIEGENYFKEGYHAEETPDS